MYGIAGVYFSNIFMISYATQFLSLDRSMVLHCMTIVAVLQFVVQLAAAFLAQRFGTTRVLLITGAWAAIVPFVMLPLVHLGTPLSITVGVGLATLAESGYYSVVAGFVSGIFVARIRYTAISIAYRWRARRRLHAARRDHHRAEHRAAMVAACAPVHERRDPVVAVRVADLAPREHRRCGRGEPEGNAAAARRSHRVIARNGQAPRLPVFARLGGASHRPRFHAIHRLPRGRRGRRAHAVALPNRARPRRQVVMTRPDTLDLGRTESARLAIEHHSIDYIPEHERHAKLASQGPFWFLGNFHFFTISIGFVRRHGPVRRLDDARGRARDHVRHDLHGVSRLAGLRWGCRR